MSYESWSGSENWTLFGLRCFCHWHIDRQPTNQEFPFHWNNNSKHNKTSTVILFLLSTPISPPFSPLICIISLLRSLRVALRKEDDHLRSSPTSQCLKLICNHKLQARGFTDSFWHPFPVKLSNNQCVKSLLLWKKQCYYSLDGGYWQQYVASTHFTPEHNRPLMGPASPVHVHLDWSGLFSVKVIKLVL